MVVHGPTEPTRPVAVVLHGVGSTAEFARRCLAGPLSHLGYDVLAPDLRGHAASTPLDNPRDHSLHHHVADLAALARIVDIRLVAGLSLGAEVALRWACARHAPGVEAHRLDGLLLCLPGVAGPSSGPAAANRAAADELASYGVADVLARMSEADGALPWVVDEVRASWSQHDPPSLVAALRAVAAEDPLPDSALAGLDVPVGIVGVTDDAAHPVEIARRLAAGLPRAALETLALTDLAFDRSTLGRAAAHALISARRGPPPAR